MSEQLKRGYIATLAAKGAIDIPTRIVVIGEVLRAALIATLILGWVLGRSPQAAPQRYTPEKVYTLSVRPPTPPDTPVRRRPPDAPAELRDSTKMFSVCSAAVAPIGARIAAEGDFSSFRDIRYSRDALPVIVLHSYSSCTTAGKGSINAIVWAPQEIERISDAQGWGVTRYGLTPRRRVSPPMLLTLEGEVVKVEEGRFTTLQRVIVRRAR